MSRFVRTLQFEPIPLSYYGDESVESVAASQDYTEFPMPITGIGPLILALVVIGIFVLLRPQVRNDPLHYALTQGDTEVIEENLDLSENVDQVAMPESETLEVSLSEVAGISPLFTPEVQYWSKEIVKWSEMYDVDANVIATIMQIESCGDPRAASHAGAQGLFQVMPFHFAPGEDMLDPDTNAMRGMAFYKEQMRYTGGDRALSFAGYNGGYAASGGEYGNWPAETQRYFYWAKGIYDAASSGATSSATLNEWLAAGGAGGCQRAAAYLGI